MRVKPRPYLPVLDCLCCRAVLTRVEILSQLKKWQEFRNTIVLTRVTLVSDRFKLRAQTHEAQWFFVALFCVQFTKKYKWINRMTKIPFFGFWASVPWIMSPCWANLHRWHIIMIKLKYGIWWDGLWSVVCP